MTKGQILKLVIWSHNHTIRSNQISTATTTTGFTMVLMLLAMGIKRLISHSATPTTIRQRRDSRKTDCGPLRLILSSQVQQQLQILQ